MPFSIICRVADAAIIAARYEAIGQFDGSYLQVHYILVNISAANAATVLMAIITATTCMCDF